MVFPSTFVQIAVEVTSVSAVLAFEGTAESVALVVYTSRVVCAG
jgi:hypothetical protein